MHYREVWWNMAGKFDAAIKDLVWKGAPALLELLVGSPVARFLNTDFSTVKERRPDLLAQLVDGRLLHVEFQTQDIQKLPWRMLDYYGVIGDRHGGLPVVQVVLYLGEKPSRMALGIDHPSLLLIRSAPHFGDRPDAAAEQPITR